MWIVRQLVQHFYKKRIGTTSYSTRTGYNVVVVKSLCTTTSRMPHRKHNLVTEKTG